jgi:hypothetical protein
MIRFWVRTVGDEYKDATPMLSLSKLTSHSESIHLRNEILGWMPHLLDKDYRMVISKFMDVYLRDNFSDDKIKHKASMYSYVLSSDLESEKESNVTSPRVMLKMMDVMYLSVKKEQKKLKRYISTSLDENSKTCATNLSRLIDYIFTHSSRKSYQVHICFLLRIIVEGCWYMYKYKPKADSTDDNQHRESNDRSKKNQATLDKSDGHLLTQDGIYVDAVTQLYLVTLSSLQVNPLDFLIGEAIRFRYVGLLRRINFLIRSEEYNDIKTNMSMHALRCMVESSSTFTSKIDANVTLKSVLKYRRKIIPAELVLADALSFISLTCMSQGLNCTELRPKMILFFMDIPLLWLCRSVNRDYYYLIMSHISPFHLVSRGELYLRGRNSQKLEEVSIGFIRTITVLLERAELCGERVDRINRESRWCDQMMLYTTVSLMIRSRMFSSSSSSSSAFVASPSSWILFSLHNVLLQLNPDKIICLSDFVEMFMPWLDLTLMVRGKSSERYKNEVEEDIAVMEQKRKTKRRRLT